ncbi:MFS transporter [Piscinibacter koreensis]|uniref:MFS transporter n=1 Tax=Piscinibacter koreensis TaxID=2742824 RepID=A0A7Y6TZA5_9BURK|nr:MFS transporter [Schlegelella koreensis]NUZ08901.1 MFS transporter [Schlegelella koreensis]
MTALRAAATESAPRWSTIAALGTSQTLAWASTYYLPAVLAGPMAHELGVSVQLVFAAFSAALVLSAVLGPSAGRSIDRFGGRPVLVVTSLVFALGLGLLAMASGPVSLFAGWAVLGVGMGSGLYEAAFATLVRLHGQRSRGAISGVTLFAGFASTIGWPLSAVLEAHFGWRGACLGWAGLHLLIGMPLNWSLPKAAHAGTAEDSASVPDEAATASPRRASILLAFVFAATWFTSTAMAAHLPRLLQAGGASLAMAVAVGALIGPAQVAGRLIEIGVLRRFHPFLSARLASVMHPIGAAVLALTGAPGAAAFALLHGMGNGILTIANGTLPLVLFGARGYGQRQSRLTMASRLAQAMSPWLFGLCLDRWGVGALWITAFLGLASFAALMALPQPSQGPQPVQGAAAGA